MKWPECPGLYVLPKQLVKVKHGTMMSTSEEDDGPFARGEIRGYGLAKVYVPGLIMDLTTMREDDRATPEAPCG